MEYTNKPFLCRHCGNQGIMIEHSGYTNEVHLEYYDSYEKYKLFECPVCHKPTIYESIISDEDFDVDDKGNRVPVEIIVYPHNGLNYCVPKDIRQAYESALLTKNTDLNIFALSLRRTLELIVNDQKAEGRTLFDKIQYLSNAGVFPKTLNEAADTTRLIGNIGAHNIITKDLSMYDLEKLSEIVKYIIQYVYILPTEIRRLNQKTTNSNTPASCDTQKKPS